MIMLRPSGRGSLAGFLPLLLLLLLLGGAAAGGAQTKEDVSFPAPQGYVTDTQGLLTGAERARLNALLGELERLTGAQIAVATVASTQPLPVDDYAVRLFERWKIGKKGKDNGILLVVASEDRKLWITVGYGLEGAVPDATAGRIHREILQPAFRAGDFGQGITAACLAMAQLVAEEYGVELESAKGMTRATRRTTRRRTFSLAPIIFFIIMMILLRKRGRGGMGPLWLLMFLGMSRGGGGYWSGGGRGGFGGGFGGFGGGMTGGGGAGGGW
jgi:uncharacterized protein